MTNPLIDICDTVAINKKFKTRPKLLLRKLSWPYTFYANLIKLAAIFEVLEHVKDFGTIGYGNNFFFFFFF